MVLYPQKSCSKCVFTDKFVANHIFALQFCIFSPSFEKIDLVVWESKYFFRILFSKKMSRVNF
jgi:hypothetical protein